MYAPFADAVRAGGRDAVYGQWHPNSRGYLLTAQAIATELQRRNLLPKMGP